jgi:hypothetical protein
MSVTRVTHIFEEAEQLAQAAAGQPAIPPVLPPEEAPQSKDDQALASLKGIEGLLRELIDLNKSPEPAKEEVAPSGPDAEVAPPTAEEPKPGQVPARKRYP